MAAALYQFTRAIQICGERVSSGNMDTLAMQTGDYGSFDSTTDQFSLYPYNGCAGIIVYVSSGLVNTLVTNGWATATGALPTGLPTAHG